MDGGEERRRKRRGRRERREERGRRGVVDGWKDGKRERAWAAGTAAVVSRSSQAEKRR